MEVKSAEESPGASTMYKLDTPSQKQLRAVSKYLMEEKRLRYVGMSLG